MALWLISIWRKAKGGVRRNRSAWLKRENARNGENESRLGEKPEISAAAARAEESSIKLISMALAAKRKAVSAYCSAYLGNISSHQWRIENENIANNPGGGDGGVMQSVCGSMAKRHAPALAASRRALRCLMSAVINSMASA
jgi:hypothetical protein